MTRESITHHLSSFFLPLVVNSVLSLYDIPQVFPQSQLGNLQLMNSIIVFIVSNESILYLLLRYEVPPLSVAPPVQLSVEEETLIRFITTDLIFVLPQ